MVIRDLPVGAIFKPSDSELRFVKVSLTDVRDGRHGYYALQQFKDYCNWFPDDVVIIQLRENWASELDDE